MGIHGIFNNLGSSFGTNSMYIIDGEKNRHTMNETRLAKVYEGNPAQISTLNGTYMK